MEKKTTVLQVGPLPPPIGGISIFLDHLRKVDSDEVSHEFFNIFPNKNTKLNKAIYNIVVYFKFLFVLLKVKPEIIHVHTAAYRSFWKNTGIIYISKLFNKKVVMHLHSGHFSDFHEKNSDRNKRIITKVLHTCDKLICLSSGWKEYYTKTFDLDSNRIEVVTNAIFVDDYISPNKSRTPDLNILYIGSLTENKGLKDLVEIAKELKNKYNSNYKFTVIGNGPLYNYIKDEKQKHSLNIELCGELSGNEKTREFKNADVLLLPSYFEGMPLCILEGLAAGHVIISTNVGAIPEVVKESENGYLYQPGDVEKAVSIIMDLNKDKVDEISKKNVRYAQESCDFQQLAKKLDLIYLSIL